MKRLSMLFICLLGLSVSSLAQLWKIYSDSAKIFQNEKITDKAIKYFKKAQDELTKDSSGTLTYANNNMSLADIYLSARQYDKAEPLILAARAIREKKLGKNSVEYANCSMNLADLYYSAGKTEKAESFVIEARQIRGEVLGKDHPDYIQSCKLLGMVYTMMRNLEKGVPAFQEVKQVSEKLKGKNHADYAASCDNLATLYYYMGRYEQAESLYSEAKPIWESTVGREHISYAIHCINYGRLYFNMGQFENAEPLYVQAFQIFEKKFGKNHPNYATACNNLGELYGLTGKKEKAEPLLLASRQIRGTVFGKKHPYYVTSCNKLGSLYATFNEYDKAFSFFNESLQILEEMKDTEDDSYAYTSFDLGQLYREIGEFEKAETYLVTANRIFEKLLGKANMDYTQSCNNLAVVYWKKGDYAKADSFFTEAFASHLNIIKNVFAFTSEAEKQAFVMAAQGINDSYLSYKLDPKSQGNNGLLFDQILAKRHALLQFSRQLRESINNSNDPALVDQYRDWIDTRELLSYWYTQPVNDQQIHLKPLVEKANNLEKQLTKKSAGFKNSQQLQSISWKDIQQALKPNEAAIEFNEFRYFNGMNWTDSTWYMAVVVRNDKPEPELILLFEKKRLDSILNYRNTSPGQQRLNQLYTTGSKGKFTIGDLTWAPLEPALNGIKKIYFTPAGSLYKISFAALPLNTTTTVSDKYQLEQLSSTSSLVFKSNVGISSKDKIILYGGIQYDADSVALKNAALNDAGYDLATRSLPDDLLRDGLPEFSYLEGTGKEITGITRLAGQMKLNVVTVEGIRATEESFKTLNGDDSPSVLHLATHGFFFQDPGNRVRNDKLGGSTAIRDSDNPLIRSGLALAGANNAWKGKPVSGVEDGILTAYEVSNMYLPNTELAVLSACETGLGDIQGSEGVYGLQRAFKIAGVSNLIMSLWKVPDAETSEFMQLFYKNLFSGQTIQNAFYQAQSILKNKYRNEPYKWAAWILLQ